MVDPNLQRKDGTFWVSSYKSEGFALASLFDKSIPSFFFREVKKNEHRKWWSWWRPKWRETGKTWEGENPILSGEFSELDGDG